MLFPLLEFLFLLRGFPVSGTSHITAVLSPQRRSGSDEMSLGVTGHGALRAVVNTVFLVLHLGVEGVTTLEGDVSEKNATRFRAL